MNAPKVDWVTVVGRLETLEKQNHRLKVVGTAVLILAAAFVLMGQAPRTRTVEANEFVLKDADGKVRGRLSVESYGPELVLMDSDGRRRAKLSVVADHPGVFLQDKDGNAVVSLVSISNEPSLYLNGTDGTQTIAGVRPLASDQPDGSLRKTSAASLVLFDKDKNVIWKAP